MSTFCIFLVALVTAFVATNSFHMGATSLYNSKIRSARNFNLLMTVTTDELVVAYEQIKQQVRNIEQ